MLGLIASAVKSVGRRDVIEGSHRHSRTPPDILDGCEGLLRARRCDAIIGAAIH
jgi:hypothetical protein